MFSNKNRGSEAKNKRVFILYLSVLACGLRFFCGRLVVDETAEVYLASLLIPHALILFRCKLELKDLLSPIVVRLRRDLQVPIEAALVGLKVGRRRILIGRGRTLNVFADDSAELLLSDCKPVVRGALTCNFGIVPVILDRASPLKARSFNERGPFLLLRKH